MPLLFVCPTTTALRGRTRRVLARLEGRIMEFLLDSGAEVSVLPKSIMDYSNLLTYPYLFLTTKRGRLCMVPGMV